jgi:hypothetical protein
MTFVVLCVAIFSCLHLRHLRAGGGPENVLIVVNEKSDSSKLIANHYISLRQIPDRNVVYLPSVPFKETIEYPTFEANILRPVLRAIEDRKLNGSIDYIVYSSDFPTTVRIQGIQKEFIAKAETLGNSFLKQLYHPSASITSLTYLAGRCIHAPADVMSLKANHYFRIPTSTMLRTPFVGALQQEFERSISAINKPSTDPLFQSAEQSLSRMAKSNPGQTAVLYWLAKFAARKGDAKAATRWMTRAISMGWSDRSGTLADPDFAEIDDTVFQGIVRRMGNHGKQDIAPRAFRQVYQWAPNGMQNRIAGQGERYFLSTVLAVTRNDGNTEAEAIRQLTRTAKADFTRPSGTFYFSSTSDVRSKTRKAKFNNTIVALQDIGYRSEIIKSILPVQKDDVLGLTTGSPKFAWEKSKSSVVPGAICENLTSYGGRLNNTGKQSALNEFLRHGAAGSSGTVIEPYTVVQKFPTPMIHFYYARGCSLAEAFYQSLHGPFQTLIVGDALCQPFATPPRVSVSGIGPMEVVSGVKRLTFNKEGTPVRVAGMELYVDGNLKRRDRSLEPIDFDTSGLSDGYHEIRIVFVAANQIETSSREILKLIVNNNNHNCILTTSSPACGINDSISFTFAAEGASDIRLCLHEKVLNEVTGSGGAFTVPAKVLGRGPSTLRAIATIGGKEVSSKPVKIQVNGPLKETRERTGKQKAKSK